MKTDVIRLGVIGGGVNSAVGTSHFIAAQMDGYFRVESGCFSRHKEVNDATAKQWRIDQNRVHYQWDKLLDREQGQVDAILVLTPTPEHAEPVIAALEAGYPVICEKALAATSDDVASIQNILDKTEGFLAVTYNYTGYPMLRELKAMIANGRLGTIEQIHIEMPQEGFSRISSDGNAMVPQQWRLKDGDIPTISLDLGVHVHHLVDFLTGEKPIELVASQSSFGQFRQVVDSTMAIVRYSNAVECSFWFSKAALGYRNGLRVRVFGVEGSAEWYQMDPEILIFNDRLGHKSIIDRSGIDTEVAHLKRYNRFKPGHPAGFLEAFANIYADIGKTLLLSPFVDEEAAGYVFSAQHAWEGLVMLEAIALSAKKRNWVNVNFERR